MNEVMDILALTDKDLFKLRLYDEPIVIDASMHVGKWASPEQSEHLKTLGVVEQSDSGKWIITHPLRILIQSEWEEEPYWKDIEKGTVLRNSARPNRKYS